MKLSKRLRQLYTSFIITAALTIVHGLLNFGYDKQEWISLAFLILSLIIFLVILTYSAMEFAITKEPSDLWKAGFLGVFGLIGLVPAFGFGFFALFALFVFFGARQYF